jgi:hypothetical protein
VSQVQAQKKNRHSLANSVNDEPINSIEDPKEIDSQENLEKI